MSASGSYLEWVRILLATGSKKEKKIKLGILFMFWWQIWKERNNRVFHEGEHSVTRVVGLIKEQVYSLAQARSIPSGSTNE
jgi:hypothetical protein